MVATSFFKIGKWLKVLQRFNNFLTLEKFQSGDGPKSCFRSATDTSFSAASFSEMFLGRSIFSFRSWFLLESKRTYYAEWVSNSISSTNSGRVCHP